MDMNPLKKRLLLQHVCAERKLGRALIIIFHMLAFVLYFFFMIFAIVAEEPEDEAVFISFSAVWIELLPVLWEPILEKELEHLPKIYGLTLIGLRILGWCGAIVLACYSGQNPEFFHAALIVYFWGYKALVNLSYKVFKKVIKWCHLSKEIQDEDFEFNAFDVHDIKLQEIKNHDMKERLI
ncbi:hypothetical protein RFI_23070 [Reticulomyxa filosa]|uniref:Uncharacterized protein n=1 Tax=Reticulomyxa filosa TaxID=46433 RepID=X6MJW1_RETFI|nr:hypothetical protein RFI_23070 [Reticulomyxa filosa]|eukprot:ETO14298.1 hypothetical protein RFI_23070 [Reticulomyxa filosa]